jgi:hypothetical protein
MRTLLFITPNLGPGKFWTLVAVADGIIIIIFLIMLVDSGDLAIVLV